jgi:hypothetical protein
MPQSVEPKGKIEVIPAMIEAGVKVYLESVTEDESELVCQIFLAMLQASEAALAGAGSRSWKPSV